MIFLCNWVIFSFQPLIFQGCFHKWRICVALRCFVKSFLGLGVLMCHLPVLPLLSRLLFVFFQGVTLPETNNKSPWKWTFPKRKGSSPNHQFSGANCQFQGWSHGLKVKSHGLKVKSHGLKVKSHGLKVKSHGLKVKSHGLKVKSHGLKCQVPWVEGQELFLFGFLKGGGRLGISFLDHDSLKESYIYI